VLTGTVLILKKQVRVKTFLTLRSESGSTPSARTIWISLFLVSGFFTHFTLNTNSAPRYSLTKSIVEEGSFSISNTLPVVFDMEKAIDRAEYKGQMYSDKAPFGSILGVPVYWLLSKLFPDEAVRIFFMSLFLNVLPFSLIGILLFQFARRQRYTREESYFASIVFLLGTNVLYWSTTLFSHPLTSLLLFSAILLLYYDNGPRLVFAGGLIYGCGVANDYYLVTGVPILLSWMWFRSKRDLALLICGLAGPAILLMAYHYWVFGNPFSLPYHHHIYFGDVHRQGLSGVGLFAPGSLWTLWLSPSYGLFFFNPILILFLLSIPKAYRENRPLFMIVVAFILVFTFIVGSIQERTFGLGSSWGPRYLVCLIPLIIIVTLQNHSGSLIRKPFFILLGILSVLLNYLIVWVHILPPKYGALGWLVGDGLMLANRGAGYSAISSINNAYDLNIPWSLRVLFALFVMMLPFAEGFVRLRAARLRVHGAQGQSIDAAPK
jgi:hypothetical protein